MEPESRPLTFRTVLLTGILIAGGLIAAFALWNYVNAMREPRPTVMASAVVVAASPSALLTATDPSPASTPKANNPEGSNPDSVVMPSKTPRITRLPATDEPRPSPSPTSRPQIAPTLATITSTQFVDPTVPTPVPTFEVPAGTTNILLLGSDVKLEEGVGRTDTMIIVSVNQDGPTASMVSLPRDLWVYIPGWTMNRINTTLSRGSTVAYPGGALAQLKDTIMYNFGVPIHYYAQVDFEGFKQAVDLVGGIEVAVTCRLRDWRLISPELDPTVEENWEMFTLEPGIHQMDGDMALWYARSRLTTSDFDRGRRQQQLLRAMLNKGVDINLLPQVPELWNTYQDSIKTDMDIGRLLQLATLASEVKENGIQHLYIVGDQLQPYTVPSSGANVQLPVWEKVQDTFRRLFLPPALNKASRPPITVEIINGTDDPERARLVAENLAWYGFVPVISDEKIEVQQETTIQYYAQNFKGSFDWLLSWILDQPTQYIELVPDTEYDYDYKIVLGTDHSPCRPQLFAPQIFLGEE